MSKNKIKEIKDSINKVVGANAVLTVNDYDVFEGDVYSTGSIGVDICSGIGGFPSGRVIELIGDESAGKTTLALQTIAHCQSIGGIAAFVDAENAIDLNYAEDLGVNVDDLLLSQPDNGEQAFEIIEKLIALDVNIIVVDSVAALTPKAEIEGNYGDSKMGLHARLMSQAMRKLTSLIKKHKTCVIFTNQIRLKIGVLFGNPETTTGGNALKFYSSIRLRIRRKESPNALDKNTDAHSNTIRVTFIKNKCAPPFKKCEYEILFGYGVDQIKELAHYSVKHEVIIKQGNSYYYNEELIATKKDGVEDFLDSDDEAALKIKKQLYKKLNL